MCLIRAHEELSRKAAKERKAQCRAFALFAPLRETFTSLPALTKYFPPDL